MAYNQTELYHLDGLKDKEIDKLIDSQESVTYKELCERLGIKYIPVGNSKNSQLTQLDNLVEYHKTGIKYKLLRLREPEERMLYQGRSEYVPYIELILSELLKECILKEDENRIVFLSTMEMIYYCNMVNENYKVIKNQNAFHKAAIASINNFNVGELNLFVDLTYEKVLKPIIASALKSMDNKKSIVVNKGYKAYYKSHAWSSYTNILSTSTEGKVLGRIEADAFTELGIKDSRDLFLKGKVAMKRYYDLCNEKCKELLGYDGFYNCYALVINKNRIDYNVKQLQTDLNNKIKQRVLSTKTLDVLTTASRKVFTEAMIEFDTNYDFQRDIDLYEKNINESLK